MQARGVASDGLSASCARARGPRRPAAFGTFTPGVDRSYDASTTANVISTAGDATLWVTDASSTATGRLVNGAFALSEPLEARAGTGAFAPLSTTAGSPLTVLTYTGPVSNDAVTIGFRQHIGSTQPLRTGAYSKTLVDPRPRASACGRGERGRYGEQTVSRLSSRGAPLRLSWSRGAT